MERDSDLCTRLYKQRSELLGKKVDQLHSDIAKILEELDSQKRQAPS